MSAKSTVISLVLIASLHGQAFQGDNVLISPTRLQNLNPDHISFLVQEKVISFQNEQAVLNLVRLDGLVKSYEKLGDFTEAKMIRARVIPYGCT